jgi:signal transduction histidine kinase
VVRLSTKRSAFLLYSLLLVLPAVALGGLHWHQLWLDYQVELAAVPEGARDAARRLTDSISESLTQLLEKETARPFHHYADIYAIGDGLDTGLSLHYSPLVREELPRGVLGWFNYNLADGPAAEIELFLGAAAIGPEIELQSRKQDLEEAGENLVVRNLEDGFLRRAARLGSVETVEYPLVIAAVNREQTRLDCSREHMLVLSSESVLIDSSQFHLRFYIDKDGQPRALATRRVLMGDLSPKLIDYAPCLESLREGFGLVQGFFIDTNWLFAELPVWVSDRVLTGSERFLDEDKASEEPVIATSEYRFPVSLVNSLGFEEASDDTSIGHVNVVIDKGEIESRFQAQSWRFFGVAAMLALTLGTGMALLLRSVNRELEQAQQTENFVAAVTHELRTPLSTIRLHAEMLQEGWVSDEAKRSEYYERIVRETGRLSTLVERVLEKARLSSNLAKPEPGDITKLVEQLKPELEQRAGGDGSDLVFLLEPSLPSVMLVPEAISGILDNLVENARKYAPADRSSEDSRIEIRTRKLDGGVVLEVADRGPGIPAEEVPRIFEAFYRVGNETTRVSTGTGLGLHLVAVHADSMGARASAEMRKNGGACFRINLRRA